MSLGVLYSAKKCIAVFFFGDNFYAYDISNLFLVWLRYESNWADVPMDAFNVHDPTVFPEISVILINPFCMIVGYRLVLTANWFNLWLIINPFLILCKLILMIPNSLWSYESQNYRMNGTLSILFN